jgi:hypothetical protein
VKTILVLIVWKFLPTQIFKGKDIFFEADFGKDFMANDFFMIFFSCNELLVGWLQLWVREEDRELDDSGRSIESEAKKVNRAEERKKRARRLKTWSKRFW